MQVNETIIKELTGPGIKTQADLMRVKRKIAKKTRTSFVKNSDLLKTYHELVQNKRIKKSEKLENILKTRPIRSLSGIVNVSVLTKPYPCPGKCIYCPSQENAPKSYLDNEPAVMRAISNQYDPVKQVKNRIQMLEENGHPTDKVELRIIGGTWSFYPKRYQTNFIKNCFDACNQAKSVNLKQAHHKNEKAKHRLVGLSVETRPDFINEKEIKRMRDLGITRVELGIQSIYDDVLKINKRGHKIEAAIKATKLLKDAGFKVSYQMMLNLPGSDLKKDLEMFKQLFSNSNFQPDLLKIYPTALLKEAPLYKWWLRGEYKPYTLEQLVNLIKSIKKYVPYYVRIERIIRDIPATSIVAGPVKTSNLRQLVAKAIEKEGWHCHCIRCREIGKDYNKNEKLKLFREDYDASQGKEIFLSFEDEKRSKIYSLLRLRIAPVKKHFLSVLSNAAIIREIHTYGQQLALGQEKMPNNSAQHKGLGKKLILEAEKITQIEFGLKKIAIISAVGTRGYFKKLGYRLKDEYMIKNL